MPPYGCTVRRGLLPGALSCASAFTGRPSRAAEDVLASEYVAGPAVRTSAHGRGPATRGCGHSAGRHWSSSCWWYARWPCCAAGGADDQGAERLLHALTAAQSCGDTWRMVLGSCLQGLRSYPRPSVGWSASWDPVSGLCRRGYSSVMPDPDRHDCGAELRCLLCARVLCLVCGVFRRMQVSCVPGFGSRLRGSESICRLECFPGPGSSTVSPRMLTRDARSRTSRGLIGSTQMSVRLALPTCIM